MKQKIIAAAIGTLGLMSSGSAFAISAGGVNFGAVGAFQHLETTTVAETLVLAVGDTLTGYGQVNTVNGDLNYAGSDRLYFTFSYLTDSFSPTSVGFKNGTINFFKGANFNLQNQDSPTNLATISAYTPWLTLKGHADTTGYDLAANGQLVGTNIVFTGGGLLDVVGGLADVVALLDSNSEADGLGGFADITLTSSGSNSVLNVFDVQNGHAENCNVATGQIAGEWCLAGSADLRGKTNPVPEPETLVLLGAGLLGLSTMSRKKA